MGSMTGAHKCAHPAKNRKQSVFCTFLSYVYLHVFISKQYYYVACEGSLTNLHTGAH